MMEFIYGAITGGVTVFVVLMGWTLWQFKKRANAMGMSMKQARDAAKNVDGAIDQFKDMLDAMNKPPKEEDDRNDVV